VEVAVLALFALVGLVCVGSVAFSLPGGWAMLGLALILELTDTLIFGATTHVTFGWWAIGGGVLLALLGEGIELGAAALGVKKGGGSRRAAIGSIAGGLLGGLFLTFLIPIPIIGTLIGALLGTFLGALIGELSVDAKKSTKDAVRPALWATAATLMGNIVKTGLAMAAWLVLMASAIL
jgi:hypothetical protein